ncbi:lipid IV(A) 3-deoxy-D-manno-octulosonic acid transferase [Viridibacterium curvum]|uniref:3-deoxy-D-manno-octulosonic acid transferase n=1 Tax=Viridibacterium curvum TaxID=1101404 RepID=A0ABP9QLG5_9RHOO
MRTLYTLLWLLGMPLVVGRLAWRARRQPGYLQHWSERFGKIAAGTRPTIWLHAVSVGETRAAEPLVKALLAAFPEHEVLLTCMTPTGRETGQALFGKLDRVRQSWLPYDLPWLQRRFLQTVRPVCGIVMETEVWPNLLLCARALGVPLLLANARLSARSARGYGRLGKLAHAAFGSFNIVAAQSEADAERIRALGGHQVVVSGNIKYDVAIPDTAAALAVHFSALTLGRPILLAASTREGEEALIVEAFKAQLRDNTLLVLVPRHPQRFDDVAELVTRAALRLERRSSNMALSPDTEVWLGDSMGEMAAYFAFADVALIGGSWLPFGSQNLIESCAAGTPVLIGPSSFNFAEAAELAIAAGAARRCVDVAEALDVALQWLADKPTREAMGAAGKAFCAQHGGATARLVQMVEGLLA